LSLHPLPDMSPEPSPSPEMVEVEFKFKVDIGPNTIDPMHEWPRSPKLEGTRPTGPIGRLRLCPTVVGYMSNDEEISIDRYFSNHNKEQ